MTKSAKTTRKRTPAARKTAKVGAVSARRASRARKQPTRKEEAAFVETLIASGEAAHLDAQGRLPAGATHTIVEDAAGNTKVVRRRFSIA